MRTGETQGFINNVVCFMRSNGLALCVDLLKILLKTVRDFGPPFIGNGLLLDGTDADRLVFQDTPAQKAFNSGFLVKGIECKRGWLAFTARSSSDIEDV